MGTSLHQSRKKLHGFTLVELMVVIALVAIVMAIAIPSYRQMIVSNRIRAATNDLLLSLQFARTEAVRQVRVVTVCPSSDGATCTAGGYEIGWIVKTGLPNVAGVLLQDTLPKEQVTMTTNSGNFIFLANGLPAANFAGSRIQVRDFPANQADTSKWICIARTGRARVFTDAQYMTVTGTC
jgi:type IV fimbrial biogenesis protein FimT